MRWQFLLMVALLAAGFDGVAQSELVQPKPTLTFVLAQSALPIASIQVANGVPVRREDWPTLVFAKKFSPGKKDATCTGALVGPRAILTAAHCLDSKDGPFQAQVLIGSALVDLKCAFNPEYLVSTYVDGVPRNSFDHALCVITSKKKFNQLTSLRFEVVDIDSPLEKGEPVLFTGYGCTKLRQESYGALDWNGGGELTVGDARVDRSQGEWPSSPAYVSFRTDPAKEATACPGDSGGPLFSGVMANAVGRGAARRVRGVNSHVCEHKKVDVNDRCTNVWGVGSWEVVSSVSAVSNNQFRSWAREWSNQNSAPICGITLKYGEPPCRE